MFTPDFQARKAADLRELGFAERIKRLYEVGSRLFPVLDRHPELQSLAQK